MHFQGRGNVYLQKINSDGTLAAAIKLCTDTLSIGLTTDSAEHINRCGAVDVPDARIDKAKSATVNMTLASMDDKFFALGVLGTVVAAGSPGSVSGEVGPLDPIAGDFYFLGGKTRHRAITSLVVTDEGTSPATTKTVDVDYTLDAASGLVTFLTAWTGYAMFSYSYTDPQFVAMLNAPTENYFMSYEFINKQNSNDPGSLEVYKVRFNPADNVDFQSDELQIMSFTGSALADTDRAIDGDLGQFGRRVL